MLLLLACVGYVYAPEAADELDRGSSVGAGFTTIWLLLVSTVVPLGVLATLLLGLQSLAVKAGLLAASLI